MTEDVKEDDQACRMLTDEEVAENKRRGEITRKKVSELLEHLNPKGGKPLTELMVMIDGEAVPFNLMELNYALQAQCVAFKPPYEGYHGYNVADPRYALFPDVKFEKEGEKVVKTHYHFDSKARKAKVVVTRATASILKPDTVGQPRYDVEFHSTEVVDAYTWRLVVNGCISRFRESAGYIYLFNHDFEYIVDEEQNVVRIIPAP